MAVYIGPGVLTHDGIDYGYGETLPEDVDIAALKKSGKAADSIPAPPAATSLIETQAAKIKELGLENVELKRELLEAGEKMRQLQTDFETAQKTITQLMSASQAPAAGPRSR